MNTAPTIHVTNWSSTNKHGQGGRRFTIMIRPRSWETGDGRIPVFAPRGADLTQARNGGMSVREYMRRFRAEASRHRVGPGQLATDSGQLVRAGDTLCCSCSVRNAERGECHRVVAADLLRLAGWRVLLDGRELVGLDRDGRPIFARAKHEQGELPL